MPSSSAGYGNPGGFSHKDGDTYSSRGITSSVLKLAAIPLRPIRPLLPHLLPFAVCLLCVPILMILSGIAGFAIWKSVPVGWNIETYLQYGETANPFAMTRLPPILANQPYDISLHLVLPATEANYALGNFMTTLRLSTTYNESIVTVRRSTALVPPGTSLLKQVVMGSQPLIKLDIPLLSQFSAGSTNVIAYLELGRPDAWKNVGNGQPREVNVAEAILKGTVRPTGIRAIRVRYPRLTTLLSTIIFFSVSIVVAVGFLFSAIGDKSSKHLPLPIGKDEDSESDRNDGDHDEDDYLKPRLVTRHGYRDFNGESEPSTNESHKPKLEPQDKILMSGSHTWTSTRNTTSADIHRRRPSQIKIETDELDVSEERHSAYPKSPFPSAVDTDLDAATPQEFVDDYKLSPSEDATTDSKS